MDTVEASTRNKLGEEGEYTHEDELLLDDEGFIIRKVYEEELESLKNEEGFIES